MKIDFDNMRTQFIHEYNDLVDFLNNHTTTDEYPEERKLVVRQYDLERLHEKVHAIKMKAVTLACMSGENETFGEVGEDMEFLNFDYDGEEII